MHNRNNYFPLCIAYFEVRILHCLMNVPPRRGMRNMKIDDKDESCSLMERGWRCGAGWGGGQENNLHSDLINCHALTFTGDGINLLPIFIIKWRWKNIAKPPRSV